MTAQSAGTAISGARRGIKILSVTMAVIAGCVALWYRATFHAWPGQQGSRVHWCGRDYEYFGTSETWAQVTSRERLPVRPVGTYPPLGPHYELFATPIPDKQRFSVSPPLVCAVLVYLRTGPGEYQVYSLEGGP
ncbi:MAG TPA: hypothetical protein VGF54_04200 [Streptosporangiaceae bacterium]|jgi:hypothetical protein